MTARRKRKLPVWLTPAEVDRLVAAARWQRDRVILQVGLKLGLRVSELIALRAERIDFELGGVLVYQGKGAKDRYLPLSPQLAEALRAWLAGRTEGFVFRSSQKRKQDQPLTARAVQLMVQRTAARAGITRPDPKQKITPHKLRHTFASSLAEKGADVVLLRDLMGHASIATTNVYLHSSRERLAAAGRLIDAPTV